MHPRIFAVVLLFGAGCAPVAPQLDSRFGAAVRVLMAQQALPPQGHAAGSGAFDAAAAHGALAQYRQSFQAPAPAPRAFFGVVGGANASQ